MSSASSSKRPKYEIEFDPAPQSKRRTTGRKKKNEKKTAPDPTTTSSSSASTDECCFCLCDFESATAIRCAGAPKCQQRACPTCFDSYCDHSANEHLIPVCIAPDCRRPFPLAKLPAELRTKYAKCVRLQLLRDHGEKLREQLEHSNLKEIARRVQQDFIRNRFPKAIALTALIAKPEKLMKVNRLTVESMERRLEGAVRQCFNLCCRGSLDERFVCVTCETAFCEKCEKRKPSFDDTTHVCRPEDLESLEFIRKMVHCPRCGLAIERSEGCPNMTCAHCGQLFNYLTGAVGGSGSHNKAIESQDRDRSLIEVYRTTLEKLSPMAPSMVERLENEKRIVMAAAEDRALIRAMELAQHRHQAHAQAVAKAEQRKRRKTDYSSANVTAVLSEEKSGCPDESGTNENEETVPFVWTEHDDLELANVWFKHSASVSRRTTLIRGMVELETRLSDGTIHIAYLDCLYATLLG